MFDHTQYNVYNIVSDTNHGAIVSDTGPPQPYIPLPNTINMWDSRVDLRVHYASCRGLAYQIDEFMACQPSFDLSTSKAEKLQDIVAAMTEHFRETEDLWDEVAETTRMCGPR